MYILGLTGSLGMGKSAATAMLRRMRVPVFEADRTIHQLYADPVVKKILAITFPDAVKNGLIDRNKIADAVFENPELRRKLTNILYPALAVKERQFLRNMAHHRRALAVLDIPLLFETGAQSRVDGVMVVDAPAFIQRQRALARAHMTPEKLDAILATQIENRIKCRAANVVIKTGMARGKTFMALRRAIARFKQNLVGRRGVWNNFTYARNRT
jgi:dephospho-CoA kinase